jgi:hypothetical protein
MSIPLDRLYSFLHGVNNQHGDIVIYCWQPHGSKKLEDLKPLWHGYYNRTWLDRACTPTMICHDQEPLQFDLYDRPLLKQHILARFPGQIPEHSPVLDHYINMHLRAVLNEPHHGYDKVLLCHSEKNSSELAKYQQHGFVGVYYWSHALIARDWFRHAEHDLKLQNKHIVKDFLVYNRAWAGTREYRLKFSELLVANNLVGSCRTSFSSTDQDVHYGQHIWQNDKFCISESGLENFFDFNQSPSWASADYECEDYVSTGIEVVLETLFDDTRQHLTEKTLRAIACGQPFMLVATPGSLKYLRDYGFKTFDGLIDESYDCITDPLQRLLAIVSEMNRIRSLSATDKTELYTKLKPIADHNKKLFFSKHWHDAIVDEYFSNFKSAFDILGFYKTGKHYSEYKSVVHTAPKRAERFHKPILGLRTQQELDSFMSWIDNTML